MTEVVLTLVPVEQKKEGQPIFEPAEIPCGKLTHVKILEKETANGLIGVAILIELPDGSKVMTKTTGRIMQAIGKAIEGASFQWGVFEQ
jgi:hypothetical protein